MLQPSLLMKRFILAAAHAIAPQATSHRTSGVELGQSDSAQRGSCGQASAASQSLGASVKASLHEGWDRSRQTMGLNLNAAARSMPHPSPWAGLWRPACASKNFEN